MKNIRLMPDGSYVNLDKVVMIGKLNHNYLEDRAFCEIFLEDRDEPIDITLARQMGDWQRGDYETTKLYGEGCYKSIVNQWKR